MIVDGNKYIQFEFISSTGKTSRWVVLNKSHTTCLGNVVWFSGWRQYVFQPEFGTEFNNTCLDAISQFLSKLNSHQVEIPVLGRIS